MTARQIIVPGAMPSRDRNGRALPGKLRFYSPDTTTPATVYTSNALTVAHSFPILSDSAGRWPAIWANSTDSFDVAWSDQTFDALIASYSGVSPADDAVLASTDLAQGSADAAAASAAIAVANATQDNAVASAASAAAAAASATAASGSATAAAGSATTAAGFKATSTTSLTLGTGTQALTIQAAKSFAVGDWVYVLNDATHYMFGQVTAHNTTTGALTVTVPATAGCVVGSGTFTAWTVTIAGLQGPTGVTGPTGPAWSGGTLTSPVNNAPTATVASAATTDIGAASSNYVQVTGTVTITGLGTIAAGAERVVEFAGALTLTHNATSLILPGAANITTAAGDVARFVSEGGGNWRCAAYLPAAQPPGAWRAPDLIIERQAAAGSSGNSVSSGAQNRAVDTVVRNVLPGASLASNLTSLPAGTYYADVDIMCGMGSSAFSVRGYVYNNSDSANLLQSLDTWVNLPSTDRNALIVRVRGVFTISATKNIAIRTVASAAYNEGIPSTPISQGSEPNKMIHGEFWKLA